MSDTAPGRVSVAVLGAAGRMGAEVCRAVIDAADLDLVAAVDPSAEGVALSEVIGASTELVVEAGVDAAADRGAAVAVDFTVAAAALANARACAAHGIHDVIGTSGLAEPDLDSLRSSFVASNCAVVPNFALGAVLMMRFAELASPWFDTAEVIELHHDAKIDAPSGTAAATVERMAAASADWAPDPTRHEGLPGARGGAGPAGIRVHSVRLRGLVAHQEVLLGSTGQTLTIRHDSYDRTSFMPGVLLAVRGVADHPGVTVGLDALLGI